MTGKAHSKEIEVFVQGRNDKFIFNMDQMVFLAKSIKIALELIAKRNFSEDGWEHDMVTTATLSKKINNETLTEWGMKQDFELVIPLTNDEFEKVILILEAHQRLLERQAKYYKDGSMPAMVKSILKEINKR